MDSMPPGTFLFLITGVLAIIVLGGLTMLQAGLVRANAAATQCLMSIASVAICLIVYQLVGGWFGLPTGMPREEARFFGAVMTAVAALVVSGAVGERIMLWPFLIFILAFSAVICPLQFLIARELQPIGFRDLAGASYVHMTGGAAALAGVMLLGPRAGRYANNLAVPFPGSNIPLAALGAFLVWCGWFGLCAGAGAMLSASLFINIALAGAAGALTALFYAAWRFNKPDITIVINGLVAGLVAVSAAADEFSQLTAVITGGAGGVVCAFLITLLDQYKADDPSGAIPAHLGAGALGVLAAGIFGSGGGLAQLLGIILIGGVSGGVSYGVWFLIRRAFGLRCSEKADRHGLDMDELGLEAYPDFSIRTAGRPDIANLDEY